MLNELELIVSLCPNEAEAVRVLSYDVESLKTEVKELCDSEMVGVGGGVTVSVWVSVQTTDNEVVRDAMCDCEADSEFDIVSFISCENEVVKLTCRILATCGAS